MDEQLDAGYKQLHIFKFKVGSREIFQGYDCGDACVRSSRIVMIFDTVYDFNFGRAGMKTGDELPCHIRHGITGTIIFCISFNCAFLTLVTAPRQLKCVIKIGTSVNDPTEIEVMNYETIPALSDVAFMIHDMKNIAAAASSSVKIGIRNYPKGKTGFSYYYELDGAEVPLTSAFSGNSNVAASTSITGQNIVGQSVNYIFIINLSTSMTKDDWFVVQFPDTGFAYIN